MTTAKRRLTAALLLLLLPLTLAPRTSWTLEEVDYNLTASFPRASARPKAAVPLRLTVLSRSDEVIDEARLVVELSLDGARDGSRLVGASDGCTVDGAVATCSVGPIEPHGTAAVTIVGRALDKGTLLYAVTDGFSGQEFGTAQIPVVPKNRQPARR